MKRIKVVNSVCLFVFLCLLVPSGWAAPLTKEQAVKLEADYILSCQYLDNNSAAYGAFNNVAGEPTWVGPGENAMAILGLLAAADILGNATYREHAQLAADYLVSVQSQTDGAWYDQYNFSTAETNTKSTRNTAEVMMALDKLGYEASRYEAMKRGAQFLMSTQDVANKGGLDDGLVSGGKESDGSYRTQRWTSDNAYAYQAMTAASHWALAKNEKGFAVKAESAAKRILEGINNVLRGKDASHWMRVIDKDGQPVNETQYTDWISYAPVMLDVPVSGGDPLEIGEWIHERLQKGDGAVVWDDKYYPERRSPGYSFQAALVWLDTGQEQYVRDAVDWAQYSNLWVQAPDENGSKGGWIDWMDPSERAPVWQRFIDTSAYYIMIQNGGYDFSSQSPLES